MSHYTQEGMMITASPENIALLIPVVQSLGLVHSGPMSMIESTACLAIAPSGSKYGWPEYYQHLEMMRRLKEFLNIRNQSTDAGYDFVHVAFGENINGEPLGKVIEIQKAAYEEL